MKNENRINVFNNKYSFIYSFIHSFIHLIPEKFLPWLEFLWTFIIMNINEYDIGVLKRILFTAYRLKQVLFSVDENTDREPLEVFFKFLDDRSN